MLGAFDPTAVRIMADAFDEAWLIIEEDGDVNRQNRQKMRLALAKCIVELAVEPILTLLHDVRPFLLRRMDSLFLT